VYLCFNRFVLSVYEYNYKDNKNKRAGVKYVAIGLECLSISHKKLRII